EGRIFEEWRLEGTLLQQHRLERLPFRSVAHDFARDALDQHARDLERFDLAALASVDIDRYIGMLQEILQLLGAVIHDEDQVELRSFRKRLHRRGRPLLALRYE